MGKDTIEPEVEHLHMYGKRVRAALRYQDIQKDPFPTPQEAQIRIVLVNGRSIIAFVPLDNVNEENQTVVATLEARTQLEGYQNNITVSFPPTNFGQTRFTASREELDPIANYF